MNRENEFDELARQKLEGRSIPFAESDWAGMQTVLNMHNKRKKRFGFWFGGGAALLLLIGGAWYMTGTPQTSYAAQNEVAELKAKAPSEGTTSTTTSAVVVENTRTILPEKNNPAIDENDKIHVPLIEQGTSTNAPLIEAKKTAELKPGKAIVLNNVPVTKATTNKTRPATPAKPKPTATDGSRTGTTQNNGDPNTREPDVTSTSESDGPFYEGTNDAISDNVANPVGNGSVNANAGFTASSAPPDGDDALPDPSITNPAPVNGASPENGTGEPRIGEEKNIPGDGEYVNSNAPVDSAGTDGTATPPDSSATPQLPYDSLAVPPALIVPLIDPASPWDISVLSGAMLSNTHYTGSNSDTWNTDVYKQWSMTAGVEFMHLGRYLGLGTGVHYGTHSEQIRTAALDLTTYNVTNFWYLDPIDTTILSITGTTTVDSTTYFTGISIDTTINVITLGSDSTAMTEQIREARNVVNKVSYIEIPILFDAHLVQGRWSFGLRGGPTIGFLTGTRGSLPASNGEGYMDLGDQQFRKVVTGWTARAYIRYRFNAAWSIGVEPVMRGQFDSLIGVGLNRSTSAVGGLISLTHRLQK